MARHIVKRNAARDQYVMATDKILQLLMNAACNVDGIDGHIGPVHTVEYLLTETPDF